MTSRTILAATYKTLLTLFITMDKNTRAKAKSLFSANLGKSGRAASWAVAIVGVAAYTYWTNYDNGQTFTKEDQSKWNAAKDVKK